MKSQPVIELPKSGVETWLDVAAWLFVTLGFAFAIGCYSDLPDQIPTHFNASGEPDGFGSRNFIFFLPVLSLLIVGGLAFLAKSPHKFNYLTTITPQNAAFEYRKARTLLCIMNVLVSLLFTSTTWHTISAATGGPAKLGLWFGIIVTATVIAPLVILFGWRDKSHA